jgi:hypothetical protein
VGRNANLRWFVHPPEVPETVLVTATCAGSTIGVLLLGVEFDHGHAT